MMRQFNSPVPEIEAPVGQHLYLLVDGGQIDHLARSLYQLPELQTPEPIYLHPPYDVLKDVSPYLVKATPEVKQWFLDQNNPTAGFFFSSAWAQEAIADHLHQLIQVFSPYGSEVYLKMAHSETAWVLLAHHCALFWQPMQTAWLPTRLGWKILNQPQLPEDIPPVPLKLDDVQWAALGQISWRNRQENLYQHMQTYFPQRLQAQDDAYAWLESRITQGHQLGFTSEHELICYLNIIGFLGEEAVTTDQYPAIDQRLHQPSLETPAQRIERAAQLAEQYSQEQQA